MIKTVVYTVIGIPLMPYDVLRGTPVVILVSSVLEKEPADQWVMVVTPEFQTLVA
jgi:hypothetical protein